MLVEVRSDSVFISGYVNVTGRESRPVITPHGKVIEIIEHRAFEKAINKAKNIKLMLDHQREIGSTEKRTLKVWEDVIGLRAEAVITDKEVVDAARKKLLKGWSFDMRNVVDKVEKRAEGELLVRKISDFNMSEVTIAFKNNPVYSSTSLEVRAENEDLEVEYRTIKHVIETKEIEEEKPIEETIADLNEYKNRINRLKAT